MSHFILLLFFWLLIGMIGDRDYNLGTSWKWTIVTNFFLKNSQFIQCLLDFSFSASFVLQKLKFVYRTMGSHYYLNRHWFRDFAKTLHNLTTERGVLDSHRIDWKVEEKFNRCLLHVAFLFHCKILFQNENKLILNRTNPTLILYTY